jgi:hypothetical protein
LPPWEEIGSRIFRSHPGCPWENGYQESFYDKFKIDFGDPNRFKTYGELVAEIYRRIERTTIHEYIPCYGCRQPCLRKSSASYLKNIHKALLLTCPKNPDLATRTPPLLA